MSNTGTNPNFKWVNFTPQSSDPSSPNTGDLFYSDGTPRTAGVWYYDGASWSQLTAATGLVSYRNVTSTDTATNNDYILNLSGSSFTQNLFTAVGNTGKILKIRHAGINLTQVYTIDAFGTQTIGGSATFPLYTNGEELEIVSDGSNWQILSHFADTDWFSDGVIGISATATGPTKGSTQTVDRLLCKREGKNLRCRIEFKQSNATGSAAGSGDYLFRAVPTALTIDTALVTPYNTVIGSTPWQPTNIVGTAQTSNSTPSAATGVVSVYDGTRVRMFVQNSSSGGSVNSGYFPLTNTLSAYCLDYVVPITQFKP